MIITSDTIKKGIVETIKNNPQGLTIKDLATILGVHRQVVTKYILFLEGAETIHRRRIGSATLHYLKEEYEKLQKTNGNGNSNGNSKANGKTNGKKKRRWA